MPGTGSAVTSGEGLLSLDYFPAPRALAGFISSIYVFEARRPRVYDVLRAELAQLRFLVRGRGTYAFGEQPPVEVPAAALSGPSVHAARFEAEGPLLVVGCGLLPAGWAALVGERADTACDRLIDVDALLPGAGARRLVDRLGEVAAVATGALRDRTMAMLVDGWLTGLAPRQRPAPWWLTRETDRWLIESPSPSVDQLVKRLGLSARQTERWTARVYGARPKLLARKYRTLQAAVRLGLNPDGGWQEAALDAFYDQSHFIREFRMFIGVTPSAFVRPGSPWLTRLTIAKRQQAPMMPRLNRFS